MEPDPRLPSWSLRPAEAQDLAFFQQLFALSRGAGLASLDWPDSVSGPFFRQQFEFQQAHFLRHHPHADTHVILAQGRPAGRLMLQRGGQRLHLLDIALLPEQRGRGLGGAVLASVLAEADAAGLPLTLQVAWDNPAQRLYRRLGFGVEALDGPQILMRRPAPECLPTLPTPA